MEKDAEWAISTQLLLHPTIQRWSVGGCGNLEATKIVVEALRTLRSKTRKEDAKDAQEFGMKDNLNGLDRNTAYLAGVAIAQAILKKEEEENGRQHKPSITLLPASFWSRSHNNHGTHEFLSWKRNKIHYALRFKGRYC